MPKRDKRFSSTILTATCHQPNRSILVNRTRGERPNGQASDAFKLIQDTTPIECQIGCLSHYLIHLPRYFHVMCTRRSSRQRNQPTTLLRNNYKSRWTLESALCHDFCHDRFDRSGMNAIEAKRENQKRQNVDKERSRSEIGHPDVEEFCVELNQVTDFLVQSKWNPSVAATLNLIICLFKGNIAGRDG